MKCLSIIVPIYNVEKYLRECLDSIVGQTHSNLQAILVNDGSTDKSAEIAKEYVAKDSRFILIEQENRGLGSARNRGLDFIFSSKNPKQTEYIGLVDSDDVIAKDYYENLIYCLEYHDASVAKSRDIFVFKDDNYDSNIFMVTQYKTKGIMRRVSNKTLVSKVDPWRSVFRASLLQNLRFPPVRFAEDVPFGVSVNILAKNIALTKTARYFYRLRSGSLTKEQSHKPQEVFRAFEAIYSFFTTNDLLYTYTLPTHILRPSLAYTQKFPDYFPQLQEFIKSLHIQPSVLKRNHVLRIILQSDNVEEYLKRTQSFKEWRRNNFRFHISKKQIIVKLFGETLLHR
ncbi:hypothetical protein CQA53_07080 [Helicobacter didelphidarum]|uniref:Glycosyltransferase 2-like domain-containing protein n=1 Tax=Helicobacter didelphidarum TaxID=2040648 RepID=A0A3D8IJD9_9HELI|nr:glycosyltransferase [Helicobacter didelphidarum]RDU64996.1 hypothetical protein CQA53_07080 [Helicobacter didelphidarum]